MLMLMELLLLLVLLLLMLAVAFVDPHAFTPFFCSLLHRSVRLPACVPALPACACVALFLSQSFHFSPASLYQLTAACVPT